MADGRYLARAGDEEEESVLVLQGLGATASPGRRRRRHRTTAAPEPAPLSLTRVTAIRAFAPFPGEGEAARWLDEACEAEDTVDVLAEEAIALLNRALHAQAVSAADPRAHTELSPERAERVLVGYGSGEETAHGRFQEARQVDVGPRLGSRRRQREQDLRPQERVAAVLRHRERLDACETLLLRARADLDAGRHREAALQLRVGLEALLVELKGALRDPGHERDMGLLQGHATEATAISKAVLEGEVTSEQKQRVEDLLQICERVLRRRRVLRG